MKLTDLVPVPKGINKGLKQAGNRFMLATLGNPRSSYRKDCAPVTNPKLKAQIVTQNVGPFRVTGYRPAVESLRAVFADVQKELPAVYAVLGSAGMLCARLVRGSKTGISNHSWGCAIDLTIAGQLDAPGNGKVQWALVLIAPIFARHGWFWGAAFGREDAMHFEAGRALVQSWAGAKAVPPVLDVLEMGDRGPAVKELQRMLGGKIVVDGDFGPSTRAAVIAFQAENGLRPDGVVGKATFAKLRSR